MQEIIYRLMSEGDIKQVAVIEKEIFSLPWSEKSFLDSLKNENTVYIVRMASGARAQTRPSRRMAKPNAARNGFQSKVMSFTWRKQAFL